MNKKNVIKHGIKKVAPLLFSICLYTLGGSAVAETDVDSQIEVKVDVNLPTSKDSSNYRPYVAVWIESEKGKVVKTISVWSKEDDWLKDMRRWWRKAGRYDQGELDAVTGATRRPGIHTVKWDGTDQQGNVVELGNYIVNIEAAREHGSRSWIRVPFTTDAAMEEKVFTTKAAEELGSMTITVRRK